MGRMNDTCGGQNPGLDGYLHKRRIVFVVIIAHVEIDPAASPEPSFGKSIPSACSATEGDRSVCFVECRELFDGCDAMLEYGRAQLLGAWWTLLEASGADQRAICGTEEQKSQ